MKMFNWLIDLFTKETATYTRVKNEIQYKIVVTYPKGKGGAYLNDLLHILYILEKKKDSDEVLSTCK